ncbi:MAG TPA: thioredoxin family protein [Pseudogracilibacillus sp.]|nr:thioredoxin family protein [Pseudogracilibacillus sp.]
MKSVTGADIEKMPDSFVFIYSRFCGTCHVARSFLDKIEQVHNEEIFNELNASFATSFLQDYQIESVPCLLIMQQGEVKERVYTFYSIGNIYHYLYEYYPALFAETSSTDS